MRSVLLGAVCVVLPVSAFAELEVCNQSEVTASVAIGYRGAQGWTSEGWWNVAAGSCATVVSGDLPLSRYYWRAEATGASWSHDSYMFCTATDAFTIEGDEDCGPRGYDREGFNEIVLNGVDSYTLTLPASGPNTAAKSAQVAPSPASLYDDPIFAQPDMGPGTYGEPYTISGTFTGCWAEAEELECEVVSDGWRYVVSDYGPTSIPLIDMLNMTDPGTEVQITGDMIAYAGDRADVTVRDVIYVDAMANSIASGDRVPMAGLFEHLQGFWSNDDGSGNGWVVEGNQLRLIHDANVAEQYSFELAPECAASYGRGPAIIGYPEYDPSMGPACFVVTETGNRHLAVEDVVNGVYMSFSYIP